jgi:N-ethylmaleimide reductase
MEVQNSNMLFEPISFGELKLSNRMVMAPMTRSRAIGNLANELIAKYYEQRAGAGLIITEGVSPSPNGLGYARIPGIFNDTQTASWMRVTDAVHAQGGKIFMQLMHTGRASHSANMPEGAKVLAPSAVNSGTEIWTDTQGMQAAETPAEMTAPELQETIQEFVKAAENAIAAGFDGIELHGANGYLLEQFLNPHSNNRTDAYGGDATGRSRFVLEVTKAIADKIGKEKVGIRLSPHNTFNGMPAYDNTFETYDYISKELNKLGIVYIHLVEYGRAIPEGLELIHQIRENFKQVLILNAGYTKERANEVLASGLADLVAFGTPFIANPNLPHKLKHDIPLAAADPSLFFTAGAEGFTDYAIAE